MILGEVRVFEPTCFGTDLILGADHLPSGIELACTAIDGASTGRAWPPSRMQESSIAGAWPVLDLVRALVDGPCSGLYAPASFAGALHLSGWGESAAE